ncbi:hypothetical protein [Natronosalvus vescus]|uniref:hypothetical protein n=1 Tax=Natronosalvus vescus TaxID=2953881 RepID=UPI0020900E12|nr:hypothetical protein [Natronosalvus vescus]
MTLSDTREHAHGSDVVDEAAEQSTVDTSEDGTPDEESDRPDTSHLEDVEVGAGCTEIWEHLASQRENQSEGGQ